MIIRLATLNDIDAIMQLIAQVVPVMNASGNFQWDSTYPNAEVFKNDIMYQQLWIAEVEGKVAGVTAITTDQEDEYRHAGMDTSQIAIVTHRLAVGLDYRGMRIAQLLLNQAEVVARERGIDILRIDTNSNNKATRKLFPKLGYEFTGETAFKFRPNLRFYCYEKVLGGEMGTGFNK